MRARSDWLWSGRRLDRGGRLWIAGALVLLGAALCGARAWSQASLHAKSPHAWSQGSRASAFVYVGNAGSQDITVFALSASGKLELLGTVPVPGPADSGSSLPLAVSADRRFLFAAQRNEPYSVTTFSIDQSTGRLTERETGPLPDDMVYLTVDGTGRYLLAASYFGNKVTVSPIDLEGTVREESQVIETLPNAHAIIIDPSNRFVLHTSLGGDAVYQQRLDGTTGKLTPNDPAIITVKEGSGPRHITLAPDSRFAYLLCELDGSVLVMPFDTAKGTLSAPTQVASALPRRFEGEPWAADIHLTPDGAYLYASERRSSTIAGFRVNARNGMLTPLGSFETTRQPRAFAIDPSGRFLVSLGELSGRARVHGIDPRNGRLRTLRDYEVGTKPDWVEIVQLRASSSGERSRP